MRVLNSFIPFSIYFLIQALMWFFLMVTEIGAWLLLPFALMPPMWLVYGIVMLFLDYQIGRLTVKIGQHQNIVILVSLSTTFAILSASLYPFMDELSDFLRWGHWSLSKTFKTLLPSCLGGNWFVFAHLVIHFLFFFIGMLVERNQIEIQFL